jgi:uncharacterized membrane protein YhaH (DUF805 family)
VLREFLLLLYAIAVGFVAAGITASFYKMLSSEPARFALFGQSVLAWVTTFAFCALTGPVIVVDMAVKRVRDEKLPLTWLAAGVGIAAMWSCCVGIVTLELVLVLRDSLV